MKLGLDYHVLGYLAALTFDNPVVTARSTRPSPAKVGLERLDNGLGKRAKGADDENC